MPAQISEENNSDQHPWVEYCLHYHNLALRGLTILFYAVFILVGFSQIISRYILNSSVVWGEQLSRFMFVWSVFLGSALVFGEGEHISLTFLTDRLPQSVRKRLKIITNILMLVTTVWLFVIDGLRIAQRVHYQLSPAMDIPMSIPYLSIFCGGCLMSLILLLNIISEILSFFDQKKR